MDDTGEIKKFLDDYQDVKFMSARRDISSLIRTSEEYKVFLVKCYEHWNDTTKSLSKKTAILTNSDIILDHVSP